MSPITLRLRLMTVGLLLALLHPSLARAANQDGFLLGDRAALSGGAVTAIVDDASASYYNPAGLALVRGNKFELSGTAFTARWQRFKRVSTLQEGEERTRGSMGGLEILPVPTAIATVFQLTENLRLGIGLFVPISEKFSGEARNELVLLDGREAEGVVELQTSGQANSGHLALGWGPYPWLRVGLALTAGWFDAEFHQVRNLTIRPAEGDDSEPLAVLDVSRSTFTSVGFGFKAGLQLGPLFGGWRLGVNLETPSVQIFSRSRSRRLNTWTGLDFGDGQTNGFNDNRLNEDSTGLEATLAPRFTFALARDLAEGTLSAEFDYSPALRNRDIPGIDWKAVWNVRFGGAWKLSDTLSIGAGFFTDRSNLRRPNGVDPVADFYGGSGGATFATPYELADGKTIRFESTFVVRYAAARGRIDANTAVLDDLPRYAESSSETRGLIHELQLYVGTAVKY